MAKRIRKSTKRGLFIARMIEVAIIVSAILIFIWAQSHYIYVSEIAYTSENTPSDYYGFKIAHVTNIDNDSNNVTAKVKKQKPDVILVTGGLVSEDGDCNRSIRILNELNNIAATFYVLQENDMAQADYIEENTNAVRLSGKSYELESKLKTKSIQFIGLDGAVDETYLLKDELYAVEDFYADLKIVMLGNNKYNNIFKNTGIDLVLTGGTYGIRGINTYTKGAYSIDNYNLIVSGGCCSLIPNNKRFMNFPEIQIITLEDPYKENKNALEKFLDNILG